MLMVTLSVPPPGRDIHQNKGRVSKTGQRRNSEKIKQPKRINSKLM
jgi:hypothetical protein